MSEVEIWPLPEQSDPDSFGRNFPPIKMRRVHPFYEAARAIEYLMSPAGQAKVRSAIRALAAYREPELAVWESEGGAL